MEQFYGVHFHWINPDVKEEVILDTASSGGEEGMTPDGGVTESADGDISYESSGCKADNEASYEKFIALHYSYTFMETKTRAGYILHDTHPDDIPIEIITTDSSENGANSCWGPNYKYPEQYSYEITVNDTADSFAFSAEEDSEENAVYSSLFSVFHKCSRDPSDTFREKQTPAEEHRQTVGTFLSAITEFAQDVYTLFMPGEESEEEDTILEDSKSEDMELETGDLETEEFKYAEPGSTELESAELGREDIEFVNLGSEELGSAEFGSVEFEYEESEAEMLKPIKIDTINLKAVASDSNAALKDFDISPHDTIKDDHQVMQLDFGRVDEYLEKKAAQVSNGTDKDSEYNDTLNDRYERAMIAFGSGEDMFPEAYSAGIISASAGSVISPGPADGWSHCNDADGEGNMWRIYDHRTEGEIHINKRDYRLDEAAERGDSKYQSAYADSQGDGTLEGAVYGLFAAENIEHPDGKTGIVYEANDLVATAVTDRNGDASFFAYTQAPGKTYRYADGKIEARGGFTGPSDGNLYQDDVVYDDYSESTPWMTYTSHTERTYPNYSSENGNCWIGRPLILGSYYVKELSRSEGYELSIGAKDHPVTNRAQDPEAIAEAGTGFAAITTALYGEGQLSGEPTGEYGSADTNEIFFEAVSKDTGSAGFDLVIFGVPSDCTAERLDTGTKIVTAESGTGEYEEVFETDISGNPVYVTAPDSYTYPKYHEDGTYKQVETIANLTKQRIPEYDLMTLDDIPGGVTEMSLKDAMDGKSASEVQEKLMKTFDASMEEDGNFVKAKLEAALRKNSYLVPYEKDEEERKYSSLTYPVYNKGTDQGYGRINFGYPIQTIKVSKSGLTCGDLIYTLLHYYAEHPYYNYGGIEKIEDQESAYAVTLYTGRSAADNGFYVSVGGENVFFLPVNYIPTDSHVSPRQIYAVYTMDGEDLADGTRAFGYYTADSYTMGYLRMQASATFVTAAEADPEGNLISKKFLENEYYLTGEIPYDASGNPIQKSSFVEKTVPITQTVEDNRWVPIADTTWNNGSLIVHVDSCYEDIFGVYHDDGNQQEYSFRIVLPEKKILLDDEDVALLGENSGWNAGEEMSAAIYYTAVKNVTAKAYRNYQEQSFGGGAGYIKTVTLTYPGQEFVFQDGSGIPKEGTIKNPVRLNERPIRQKIRVKKELGALKERKYAWYCLNCGYENLDTASYCEFCSDERTSEEIKAVSYAHDTYSAVHSHNIDVSEGDTEGEFVLRKDWLTKLIDGDIVNENEKKIKGFTFKAYLKSNLERLYRKDDDNDQGIVIWVDRNGNTMTPQYADTNDDGNYDSFCWKYDTAFGEKILDFPQKDVTKTERGTVLCSTNVEQIYTKTDHNIDSQTHGSRDNNVWSIYSTPQGGETKDVALLEESITSERDNPVDGLAIHANSALYSYHGKNTNAAESDRINDTNSPNTGYTRLLESYPMLMKDGTETKTVETYNYEKFFDAIDAANLDRWDGDMNSTYTGSSMENDPGQHWLETFCKQYQKDDADTSIFSSRFTRGSERTDGMDADGTAGGDASTSFKPFRWIQEKMFGERLDYERYPTVLNGINTENAANTSDYARANAQASDAVRQFAEKWYLKDEAAKLVKNNGNGEDIAKTQDEGGVTGFLAEGKIPYDEAVYDQALFEAIAKSYHYLRPFYTYDLDTIYAVEWDSAEDGGADRDYTTLSAESAGTDFCYGISSYLPYGIYVIREQTPNRRDEDMDESRNRSFQTDTAKEVFVPSVYEGTGMNAATDHYDAHYQYDPIMKLTEQAKESNYSIRFGEEWNNDTGNPDEREYIIRAHNGYGDFEIYPYGLDIDRTTGSIGDGEELYVYHGYRIKQEMFDPLKDVYDKKHKGEAGLDSIEEELGGNDSCLYMDGVLSNDRGISTVNPDGDSTIFHERYYYGSLSEDQGKADGIPSMTGILTVYDGKYASALVPWSMEEPGNPEIYSSKNFSGYADVKMHNTFYAARLKVNKTDSETGEYILHDDAIFSIYAGSRYETYDEIQKDAELLKDPEEKDRFLKQFKPGDARFYMRDTKISGTKEFLEAMGAHDLIPFGRGKSDRTGVGLTYFGTVPKGTPICMEKERIDLRDGTGKRMGQLTAFTTNADVLVAGEENETEKEYANQNVGYFITPQPLGAGVYVLAEIKAPDGYVRSKPIAYEIYSDSAAYYADGNMYTKVKAVREWEKECD